MSVILVKMTTIKKIAQSPLHSPLKQLYLFLCLTVWRNYSFLVFLLLEYSFMKECNVKVVDETT